MATNKPFVISEIEHYFRGFLVDLDVQDSLGLFKKAHITAYVLCWSSAPTMCWVRVEET